MSEFIKRIQDRLKSLKQGSASNSKQGTEWFSPAVSSKTLTYGLMLACAVSATFWVMKIVQIPSTPSKPAGGINNGLKLYSNQESNSAYALFGSKPLATENIYLRGVVVTSKNPDGTLDGFAIFEIDGKPTNAISVGETIGKGLSLQSIGDEQATLLYEGQKLNFKLSKPTKDKTDKANKK